MWRSTRWKRAWSLPPFSLDDYSIRKITVDRWTIVRTWGKAAFAMTATHNKQTCQTLNALQTKYNIFNAWLFPLSLLRSELSCVFLICFVASTYVPYEWKNGTQLEIVGKNLLVRETTRTKFGERSSLVIVPRIVGVGKMDGGQTVGMYLYAFTASCLQP